jgi:hypothetical protein
MSEVPTIPLYLVFLTVTLPSSQFISRLIKKKSVSARLTVFQKKIS